MKPSAFPTVRLVLKLLMPLELHGRQEQIALSRESLGIREFRVLNSDSHMRQHYS